MAEPTIEQLRELLNYDPKTGALVWKTRSVSYFQDGKQSAAHNCAIWNGKFAGRRCQNPAARQCTNITVLRHGMKAHRVAWAIHYGSWPNGVIDHINGDAADNRISNLRDVPFIENMKNVGVGIRNTSGCVGVMFFKRDQRWHSTITVDYKTIHLGYFDTFAEAKAARNAAEKALWFHRNHGKRPSANRATQEVNL